MAIQLSDLENEREVLVKDFEALKERITQVDRELISMKSNLNAVHGAIQQVDKLIKICDSTKTMPEEKEKALNIATS
tara:strand:- start:77 stop:307 length:231 start_codon:yes stop_codon:yes gene_type:complete